MALTKITGQVVNTSTDLTVGVLTATTVSVGGTLTYEDVTNVDSVGIITARSDISIADKIVHTEDTDTAIRFPAANTFTVETGGSERLRITSSGRIGIGTTNPAAELEVIDDSSLGVISRSGSTQATDANKALRVRNNSTTDTFSVSYKGQGYFAGKMGLGTASPTETLTLNSVSGASIGFEHNGTEIATISNNNAALYVHAGSGNLLSLGANGSEAARIDTSGRLLLGTTTAGNGAADDLTLATTGNTGITVRSGASSQGAVYFSDGTSGADEYRGIILYDHSNNAMSLYSDGSERMMIDSSGRLLVGHSSNIQNQSLQVVTSNGGAAGLYKYGNNDDGSELTFFTSRNDSKGSHTVVQNGDYLGRIFFRGSDGSGFDRGAEIAVKVDGTPGTNDMPGRLEFYTTPDGSTTPAERMRIDSSGKVIISSTGNRTNHNSAQFLAVGNGSHAPMATFVPSSSNYTNIFFRNTNGNVGSINTNGSSTVYNTSSDYRLKENVVNIADGITRVKQLQPKRFNFIADSDTTVDGFLAHEAQTVVPEAVTGEKDGEEMQGIDQSKLVPLLTAALQEAIAKIETLESEVASIKG